MELKIGSLVILIFGQELLFGDRMNNILINPNQCRHYSIPVFDNPTNNYRELGIEINDDLFIPTGMDISNCRFSYRCPTQDDIQVCKRIVVSHDMGWDTLVVHINVSLVDKNNSYELY